jgi:hypothetical protein
VFSNYTVLVSTCEIISYEISESESSFQNYTLLGAPLITEDGFVIEVDTTTVMNYELFIFSSDIGGNFVVSDKIKIIVESDTEDDGFSWTPTLIGELSD